VNGSRSQWTNRQVAMWLIGLAAVLYLSSVVIILVRN
jgi:hypothetical protein